MRYNEGDAVMSLDQYSQNIILASKEFEEQKQYWLGKLQGEIVPSAFPGWNNRQTRADARETGENGHRALQYEFKPAVLDKLVAMSKNSPYGTFMIIAAALTYLLYRYTGNEDVIIAMPVLKSADQTHSFNDILLLRTTVAETGTFKDLLLVVKQTVTEADGHSHFPYVKLAELLGLELHDGKPSLKTVVLLSEIHEVEKLKNVRADLVLAFATQDNLLRLNVEYNAGVYDGNYIAAIAAHLETVLTAILENPNTPLAKLPILLEREQQQILVEFNNTRANYPREKTIHRLFAEQAARNPDRTAVTFEDRQIAYRELNQRANQLARKLKAYGSGPDQLIGIIAERSLEMIIGMLAVIKSGGAYLPIDPDYPEERIDYMLADSGARILLTYRASRERFTNRENGPTVIDLGDVSLYQGDNSLAQENLEEMNQPGDLAYVIYTSGTTGKSKGAMIEHRNVVRLMFNEKLPFDFNEQDIWTMFHSFCFDFSVWEIYGALLYGGQLIIIPKSTAQDPCAYLNLLKEHRVTVLNQTPTAFYNLVNQELQYPDRTLAIRYVIFGGEALKPVMLKEWYQKYPGVKLINMYGITETTVHVTYKEITSREIEQNISNIGKPIPTLTAYITDRELRLLPIGVPGELCVGGDGVGRGYLKRPELTAARFVENPYQAGDRLYRSGDLARFLPDGDLEYLGRIDHQVKIRGHRIELGEIESVILEFLPVKEVVVIAGEDATEGAPVGDKYLCAYYVAEIEFTLAEIRAHLAAKLPEYMIPAYFVPLEKIPMTANHKVDRKALPDPILGMGRILAEKEYEAPRNETERKLANIWQEVLHIERAGITDNFFHMGGDSIKAIHLISTINQAFESNIQMKDLYLYQTIKELSASIDSSLKDSSLESAGNDLETGLRLIKHWQLNKLADPNQACFLPEAYEDFYPLSFIQQGMVFFTKLRPDEPIYHDQFPFMFKINRFDSAVFNAVLKSMIQRHPILRTTFDLEHFGEPVQVVHSIHSQVIPQVICEDLSSHDTATQQQKIGEYLAHDIQNKFIFNHGLLWRMRLFNLGRQDFCLVLSFQHAILDGWSVASMMTEFITLFGRQFQGETSPLEPLCSSYKDYVAINLSRQTGDQAREFWKEYLQGFTRNKLPFNFSSRKINNLRESRILRRSFPANLPGLLEQKARYYQCALHDICLAAHVYLLGIITTENDIVTGVVSHDRPAMEDGEKVLGCFLNTIPVRIKVDTEMEKFKLLEATANHLRQAKVNELFLADIAEIIGERGNSGNPVFDTLLNFTDFHVLKGITELEVTGPAESALELGSNEMTNTLFDLEVSKTFDAFSLQIKYSPDYFLDDDIATAADLYLRILEEIALNDDPYLRSEALLSRDLVRDLVYDFNRTQTDYPKDKTMHRLFEEQVSRTPERAALVLGDQQLTYRELNEKANQMARILMEQGVKSGDHVALITQRGFAMIIGMMAILKCGGAYVPIDPEYPLSRKEYIINNSKVAVVLVDQASDVNCANQIIVDETAMSLYPSHNPDLPKIARNLAYVIYTSGSTGIPKGVMIEHHSAVNLILWVNREFRVNEQDALLFITSMCFDLSVYDIFGILAAGGKVVITRKEQVQNPGELKQLLLKHRITFWDSVPSTMNYLVNTLAESDRTYIQESLRLVFMSGDWIPVSLPGNLKKHFPNARVISLGGATEGTVWSIYYPVESVSEYQASIPYGRPIANNYFYILDRNLKVVPKGVAGELYIGGVGVARGYMNDGERTKASFIPDRFIDVPAGEPAPMMYKTGDLGRMLPDGNIEFLGRIDHQVKIRGYRVELGEIESQIMKHPAVREAVAVDRVDASGNKYLCAYIVWNTVLTVTEIKGYLAGELPDYMIPTYFISIGEIPLTQNGKIDRKALPEPEGNINTGTEYIAPRNETEAKLAEIWQEVLGIEKVGLHDNFFELGGHSLKATVVATSIHKRFNLEIPLREIFTNSTLMGLAEYIQKVQKSSVYTAIESVPAREYYALSPAQKRMYILNQFEEAGTSYNNPGAITIEGNLNPQRLEETFRRLINRHESLRTSFQVVNGEPVQKIHSESDPDVCAFQIEYWDINAGNQPDNQDRFIREIISGFIKSFELKKAPLLKAGLIRLTADKHILLFDMHHIISDGISMGLLIKEFAGLYNHEILPELRIQYKDFSEWQNQLISSEVFQKQEAYWLHKFSGEIPVLELPTDYPRPVIQSFSGNRIGFTMSAAVTQKLNGLATQTGATMYMVLLAAYTTLLYRYTGQTDIIVGSPIANRTHADMQNIIGMFVNTLSLRNYPAGDKEFIEYLNEVKQNALDAYENQDYQFEELVEKLDLKRDVSRNPLFDTMLVLQNMEMAALEIPGLKFTPYQFENRVAKFDLTLTASETTNGIHVEFEYCTALFKQETIERMAGHFANILESVTGNPEVRLAAIEMLSDHEKKQLLYEFNDTRAEYPKDNTIDELFAKQVEQTPDRIAVVFKEQQLTYQALNQKINQLAEVLRKKGIQPDNIVGIMVERSLEMIIGIMAILKAGGAYLPIDPGYPAERIKYMIEDSNAKILLTSKEFVVKGEAIYGITLIDLSDAQIYHEPVGNGNNSKFEFKYPRQSGAHNLAYVIYTSGSTGKPKGAMIEHHSVINRLCWMQKRYPLNESDVILQKTPFTFDVSVWELFWWAIVGARVCFLTPGGEKDPAVITEAVQRENITVMHFVPSMLNLFLDYIENYKKQELLSSLKHVFASGEALNALQVKGFNQILNKINGVKLHNLYGPTEATVDVSYFECSEEQELDVIPIGKPIDNIRLYITAPNLNLQPVGVNGELCISGAGVGRGYINQPELTREKFKTDSYFPGERIYKTGDLARWLPDGNIEFLGRMDHQVKIRGNRIELGEIENRLLEHQAIKEAVVIAREDPSNNKYLCAYIVAESELAVSELRDYISKKLPEYMIPSYFIQLDKMPLNPNGKIDRKQLPEPGGDLNTQATYEAPRNEIEMKLMEIWRKVLEGGRIGIHDNFFELGGHSLKAINILLLINQEFGLTISINELFERQTIAKMADLIQNIIAEFEEALQEINNLPED